MNERQNVLLVVLDSARAENTSLHGYERETTPFLTEFADRSTVYTQARAPSIHSIASHVSMFTGEHVEAHGAKHHTTQIDPTRTIWHELGADSGYSTGLFTNNRIVSNASNLSESFDHVHEPDYPLSERLENAVDGTVLKRAYFRWYDLLARRSEPDDSGADRSASGGDRMVEEDGSASGGDRIGEEDGSASSGDRPAGANSQPADSGSALDVITDPLSDGVARVADATGLSLGTSGYKTLHGGAFTDAFLEWEAEQDGPWAACINLMDTHSPYDPDPEFDRWADADSRRIQREAKPSVWETLQGEGWDRMEALEPLYDGTIRQADAIVRDLVDRLEARDLLSETLLVITSDHGEAFGERSRLNPDIRLRGHKWGIHEVLTHVPLVVSYPDGDGGTVVDDPVSLTDLPTLLGGAAAAEGGVDPLPARDQILASTYRLPEKKRSKYSSVENLDDYIGPWRAVYEAHDGGVRKFARHRDQHLTLDVDAPGQSTVVSREPDETVTAAFEDLVDSDLVTEATTEIDDDLEEQLEDLGYIR